MKKAIEAVLLLVHTAVLCVRLTVNICAYLHQRWAEKSVLLLRVGAASYLSLLGHQVKTCRQWRTHGPASIYFRGCLVTSGFPWYLGSVRTWQKLSILWSKRETCRPPFPSAGGFLPAVAASASANNSRSYQPYLTDHSITNRAKHLEVCANGVSFALPTS